MYSKEVEFNKSYPISFSGCTKDYSNSVLWLLFFYFISQMLVKYRHMQKGLLGDWTGEDLGC